MARLFAPIKTALIVLSLCGLLLFVRSTPAMLKNFITYISASIVHFFSSSVTTSLSSVVPSANLTYLYCTVLSGPFFCRVGIKKKPVDQHFNITFSVSTGVKIATDIFGSIVDLGHPDNLHLHQSEVLELALAIQHSSSLKGKEVLAAQMLKLSHLTRDVKDQVIGLNSRGHNAFFFISFQFLRLQNLIESDGGSKYNVQKISTALDILFDNISTEFSQLLEEIEGSLPIAARAVDLGIRISGLLLQERSKMIEAQEKTPLWRKLIDQGSWGARQLSRDLELTSESIGGLKTINKKLEDLRSVMIAYQSNVGFFKASLNAIHLADHDFGVEDEVLAIRTVIESFNHAVKQSKSDRMITNHIRISP